MKLDVILILSALNIKHILKTKEFSSKFHWDTKPNEKWELTHHVIINSNPQLSLKKAMDIQYGWDLNSYELKIDFKEPILLDIGRTMRHKIIKIDISLFNP